LTSDISYKKRYLKARNELREKERELESLRQLKFSLPTVKFEDLSIQENLVIKYTKEHPGCMKNDIINNVNIGAYVTRRKIINRLIKDGMIRSEKVNNQYYKLYYNEKSILLQTYDELNNIRNLFFVLIDKITKEQSKYGLGKTFSHPIISDIVLIYVQVLGTYIIYSLLKWPKEIDDVTTLNKLYSLVFYQLIEIQKKISESFKIKDQFPENIILNQVKSPIYRNLGPRFFILDQEKIIEILKEFKKYEDVTNEVYNLLEHVWKISFPIYKYNKVRFPSGIQFKGIPIPVPPESIDKFEELPHAIMYFLHINKIKDPEIPKILQNRLNSVIF
jgi:predicted transcriptional regulator